jgi:hypothetical protein
MSALEALKQAALAARQNAARASTDVASPRCDAARSVSMCTLVPVKQVN